MYGRSRANTTARITVVFIFKTLSRSIRFSQGLVTIVEIILTFYQLNHCRFVYILVGVSTCKAS